MTLQAYQAQVDRWVKQYGVRYFGELTHLAKKTQRDYCRHWDNPKLKP